MKIESLIAQCKKHNMKKVAVTNHGTFFNMPKIMWEAEKQGIQVIPGCELYVSWDHSCTIKDKEHGQLYHMVALATNLTGYKNLLKLCSKAYLMGRYRKPRVDKELIEQHKEGLIFTTACLNGVLSRRYTKEEKDLESIREDLEWFKEVLPGQVYLELQRHPDMPRQDKANDLIISLAKTNHMPLVATCDSHYATKEHFEAWETMMSIAMQGNPYKAANDYYLKSQEEMIELYKDLPEAIQNTQAAANRCEPIELDTSYKFPVFDTKGQSLDQCIRQNVMEGLNIRFSESNIMNGYRDEYFERAEVELEVIDEMGFNGYMLVVADFVQAAKNKGILVGPGRGSAAGSLVCWALRITDVDPIKYGLLFERFLNSARMGSADFKKISSDLPEVEGDLTIDSLLDMIESKEINHARNIKDM